MARVLYVYVSGVHSGPNPSPGLGVARAIKEAFPQAKVIGVDYSIRSSGLHWPEFDDILLNTLWNEVDFETYQKQIRNILDSGCFWISCLDLETMWLAETLGEHPNLLIPPARALRLVTKPRLYELLGGRSPFKVPPYISLQTSDYRVYEFCCNYGWNVWVKGPYYEAHRVRNWIELKNAKRLLSKTWNTDKLFLQANITGYEETVAFSAYRGELLDAVHLSKRDLTQEGKTWAGYVEEVPEEILRWLRSFVRELEWTGGGELEFIRDFSGSLWLIEINPRFPAWIYGAAIAGHNLPAILLEKASGVPAKATPKRSNGFTRVVIEIPTKEFLPLPPPPEPLTEIGQALKHPSGMPLLARRLHIVPVKDEASTCQETLAREIPEVQELKSYGHYLCKLRTPKRLLLRETTKKAFAQAKAFRDELSNLTGLDILMAYSIKTDPSSSILKIAKDNGFLAEAISQFEVKKALSVGFSPREIILNGPGKWWPSITQDTFVKAIFCDSLEELKAVIDAAKGAYIADVIGVRIRPPQVESRFGIRISTYRNFEALTALLSKVPSEYSLGVSFHIPSSMVGIHNWWHIYQSIIRWAQAIESVAGVRIRCVDVGGGWTPESWKTEFMSKLKNELLNTLNKLKNLEIVIMEPGKALVQSSKALAARIIEVRHSSSEDEAVKEIVVDASIAELPEALYRPHRILLFDQTKKEFYLLGTGRSRILGRLCMEADVLAEDVQLPEHVKPGDLLIFLDAGAYDHSMSYRFGRG